MRTNIEIDDELIASVMRGYNVRTKREAVDRALRQVHQLQLQAGLMDLWGLGWEGDFDAMRTDKPLPNYG